MQDVSIAVLSAVLVLIQPAYDLRGSFPLGRLGVLLLGTTGCLAGLMLVLPRLFRAAEDEPAPGRRALARRVGRTG